MSPMRSFAQDIANTAGSALAAQLEAELQRIVDKEMPNAMRQEIRTRCRWEPHPLEVGTDVFVVDDIPRLSVGPIQVLKEPGQHDTYLFRVWRDVKVLVKP